MYINNSQFFSRVHSICLFVNIVNFVPDVPKYVMSEHMQIDQERTMKLYMNKPTEMLTHIHYFLSWILCKLIVILHIRHLRTHQQNITTVTSTTIYKSIQQMICYDSKQYGVKVKLYYD
jgi:hypothetical protein